MHSPRHSAIRNRNCREAETAFGRTGQNWAMWITVIAFVVVVLLVNLLRTRSFDYAWRIAIIAGGVAYILVILAGDFAWM